MTRLQSLIKEVLSQPKKKDCNCGCNDCGGKAPILTEGKVKHLISEGLQYHIDKKIQLHESVYRIGSEKHFELIREARALWVRGIIDVSEDDQAILETNLGHFGMYEGEVVPLDMPMVNEEEKDRFAGSDPKAGSTIQGTGFDWEKKEKYYITRNLGRGQGMSLVKDVKNNDKPKEFKSYEDAKEEADRLERNSRNMTAYFVSDINMNILKEDYDPDAEQDDEEVFMPMDHEGRPLGESLNENEAAFEYNKARAGRIMKDLFGLDFEFDYTYKPEGDRIIIHPEGYNPDGTLFDMKDVHKEKIIRTFQDKMPKAHAQPNMGGGITVHLRGFSLEERINSILEAKKKKKKKKKKKDPPIGKPKRGGSKAYYVYVRDPKTKKIKKVSFGSGGLKAKIRNKKARNAFAARHRCKTATDRTTARYWSCRLPRYAKQLGLGSNMNTFW